MPFYIFGCHGNDYCFRPGGRESIEGDSVLSTKEKVRHRRREVHVHGISVCMAVQGDKQMVCSCGKALRDNPHKETLAV